MSMNERDAEARRLMTIDPASCMNFPLELLYVTASSLLVMI